MAQRSTRRASPSGTSKPRAEQQSALHLYPSFTSWLAHFALHMCRGPVLAALFAFVIHAPVRAIYLALGLSDLHFFMLASCVVHSSVYIGMNGFFALCDHFGWLREHKLPRTKRMLPNASLIRGTLVDTVVNQLIVYPLSTFAVFTYVVQLPNPTEPLADTFLTVWKHFALCQITNEIGFYAVHRAVHESTFLYRTIHKKHHAYVGTIGIAAEHASPIEALFANTIPTVAYCLYNRVHIVIWLTWIAWRLWETYESHSGYCFEKTLLARCGLLHSERARFHDFHHTENRGNYGTYLGLDYLLRTMDPYLISRENGDDVGPKEAAS